MRLLRGYPRCFCFRYHSTDIRVRFAPSPTGQLHLGGLRTALYNYLFAKSHGGSFILRIEDTDQNRLQPASVNGIYDVLHKFNLKPDEGPLVGGTSGPYVQSERLPFYTSHVEQLLECGHAYRCFCSSERLELLRKEAARSNSVPKYDGRCRNVSKEEAVSRMKNGEESVIRFMLNGVQTVNFHDTVFGDITQTLDESDFVIIKSDGFPTYHFANIVDDHEMQISHVIRGMEWLSSTGKHEIMYKAFGWQSPKWVHLPLITRDGQKKLSKRDSDAFVDYYTKEKGYLPISIINYLLRNGSGIRDFDGKHLYSMEELVRNFDVTTIGRRNLQIDADSLNFYGRLGFENCPDNQIVEIIRERVAQKHAKSELLSDDAYIKKVVRFLKTNEESFTHFSQLNEDKFGFFFSEPTSAAELLSKTSKDSALSVLSSVLELEKDWIKQLPSLGKKAGLNKRLSFLLIRLALIGQPSGPPIGELIDFFGIEDCRKRIRKMMRLIEEEETRQHSTRTK